MINSINSHVRWCVTLRNVCESHFDWIWMSVAMSCCFGLLSRSYLKKKKINQTVSGWLCMDSNPCFSFIFDWISLFCCVGEWYWRRIQLLAIDWKWLILWEIFRKFFLFVINFSVLSWYITLFRQSVLVIIALESSKNSVFIIINKIYVTAEGQTNRQ